MDLWATAKVAGKSWVAAAEVSCAITSRNISGHCTACPVAFAGIFSHFHASCIGMRQKRWWMSVNTIVFFASQRMNFNLTFKSVACRISNTELKWYDVMNKWKCKRESSESIDYWQFLLTNCHPPQLRCLCLAKRDRKWCVSQPDPISSKSKNEFQ